MGYRSGGDSHPAADRQVLPPQQPLMKHHDQSRQQATSADCAREQDDETGKGVIDHLRKRQRDPAFQQPQFQLEDVREVFEDSPRQGGPGRCRVRCSIADLMLLVSYPVFRSHSPAYR